MKKQKTGVISNSLIWFGAGVSIAEILTGTYFAPLGFMKGMLAIIVGHLIGGFLMFTAGMIGAMEERSAMDTVKLSFGSKGSIVFSVLNIIQLVGWTSIMIYDGALAADSILSKGVWFWGLLIGALILVWLLIGLSNLGKINTLAMLLLFVLSLILFKLVMFSDETFTRGVEEKMSFGAALELSVAMPLSWLPLISDYTKDAKEPFSVTLSSVIVYNFVSIFMYAIGMGVALHTGGGDIASIMVKAGLGIAGLLIIVFSTVTTTFLDVYSAGISAESISEKIKSKNTAIIVTLLGTAAAMVYPMDNIMGFLFFIGSVFAPMIAIQITDYFILRKPGYPGEFNKRNLLIWLVGFCIYRMLLRADGGFGSTLPSMLITILICVGVDRVIERYSRLA